MVYFKTYFWILLITGLFYCGLLIGYSDIEYINLLYFIVPGFYILLIYLFLQKVHVRPIDFEFYQFRINLPISLILLGLSVFFSLLNFNIADLTKLDFASIRTDYIDRDITLWEQLAPILMVYPFVHLLVLIANGKNLLNWKIAVLLIGVIVIGLTTGGRQILFQTLVLLFLIKGKQLLKTVSFYVVLGVFVLLASLVTLGRNDLIGVSKAQFLENVTPAEVKPVLKDESAYPGLQEVALETTFYFGHQFPAFCNKISNLQFSWLPNYPLAMQPFIERQLSKAGVIEYTQLERYNELLDLSDGSGFFRVTWSTGFLDIYFSLGIIGSVLFFTFVAWLLYNCKQNLGNLKSGKYRILQAFNIMFVITMFTTPLFFDTTIFFSYLFIFFGDLS